MLLVLKYGGNAMSSPNAPDPILDDCAERVRAGDWLVIVHGGGPQIDAELERRGVAQRRIEGLRVTDRQTLDVTEAVLGATVNKALVRAALARGMSAVGISGEDAWLLRAAPMSSSQGQSLGFVGRIVEVNQGPLIALLEHGYVPIVAPLGLAADASTALNVNADTAAGAIAGALRADAYVVVTNVERVRLRVEDPGSGIASLDTEQAEKYLATGVFDGGMRPKMQSALHALANGARRALICGSGPRAVTRALGGEATALVPA
ncbi:MAG TPA: acetylglutamate kinase [Candidatus Acidoferrales bacterium]|nr:acetylglutamate kinase [Candidatus Acidoferrales bacterium]